MLVIFSVISLALLLLQFVRPPALDAAILAVKSGKMSLLDLYATFAGRAHHLDFAGECLVLSLILAALFAWFSFRLSKQSGVSRDA